ncbi:hypothetical protein [Xanthomonas sp. SS]|uniref:hypothetical protein n=1 Tax=Xanthomonas sp. SS TaxID=2724122 RepID=UPI00163B07F9|nr:hypothetical protein [Xanthomonas sp. SS]
MGTSVAYDLVMALVPGSAAGYYAGLLMAKQSKFNSLKYEALRIVRGINYIRDDARTQILKSDKVEDLHLIASELFQLKHKTAGEKVLLVSREVSNAIASCEISNYSAESLMENIATWQKQLREIRVSKRFFLPWGQI